MFVLGEGAENVSAVTIHSMRWKLTARWKPMHKKDSLFVPGILTGTKAMLMKRRGTSCIRAIIFSSGDDGCRKILHTANFSL